MPNILHDNNECVQYNDEGNLYDEQPLYKKQN